MRGVGASFRRAASFGSRGTTGRRSGPRLKRRSLPSPASPGPAAAPARRPPTKGTRDGRQYISVGSGQISRAGPAPGRRGPPRTWGRKGFVSGAGIGLRQAPRSAALDSQGRRMPKDEINPPGILGRYGAEDETLGLALLALRPPPGLAFEDDIFGLAVGGGAVERRQRERRACSPPIGSRTGPTKPLSLQFSVPRTGLDRPFRSPGGPELPPPVDERASASPSARRGTSFGLNWNRPSLGVKRGDRPATTNGSPGADLAGLVFSSASLECSGRGMDAAPPLRYPWPITEDRPTCAGGPERDRTVSGRPFASRAPRFPS